MPRTPDDWSEEALRLHAHYRGKIQSMPKVPVRGLRDFSIWYTPGVAAACRAIDREPGQVYELTNRANTVAIVSDGSRVLGLGDIGPEAGLPVMEGKALLFKVLGGVDAVPLCLSVGQEEEIVRTVEAIGPSFGGINLEDISQPKCFRVLERLRESMPIPVWHDDQQGSATALLGGLTNALKVVGKDLREIRIAMVGMGAANVSTYRLLKASGVAPEAIIACDTKGTLHRDRADLEADRETFVEKWQVACETNPGKVEGGIAEAMRGADVCIAFTRSGPGIIGPAWVQAMAEDAIVFACANPIPEIWPDDAKAAGARIVGTGRSDFPNQVNNSLVFPGLFRGVLDARAKRITDEMAVAAAHELAICIGNDELDDTRILPTMDDPAVPVRVAVAAGMAAQAQGLTDRPIAAEQLRERAQAAIDASRRLLEAAFPSDR